MIRNNRWMARLGVATAVIAGLLLSSGVAYAAPSTVTYDCRTKVRDTYEYFPYSRGVDVQAPVSVARNAKFDVVFDPTPITANAQFNKTVLHVQIAYRLPANAKLKSFSLSGGANIDKSFEWVQVRGRDLILHATGPFQGGVEFDLPTLTVKLQATNAPDDIVFVPGGSSYQNPGFYWYRYQPTLMEWGPFECFPDVAKPVEFARTQVTPRV